jgi:hypothetical protein
VKTLAGVVLENNTQRKQVQVAGGEDTWLLNTTQLYSIRWHLLWKQITCCDEGTEVFMLVGARCQWYTHK